MIVAWVHDCTGSESGYVKFLAELRSGNSDAGIERVSLDPEAKRWEYDPPLTFRGGTMDAPKDQLHARVSESFGRRLKPPRMR